MSGVPPTSSGTPVALVESESAHWEQSNRWRKDEHHWMVAVWSDRWRDRQVPHARPRPGWLDRHDPAWYCRLLRGWIPRLDADGREQSGRWLDWLDHRCDGASAHLPDGRRPAQSRLKHYVPGEADKGLASREAFVFLGRLMALGSGLLGGTRPKDPKSPEPRAQSLVP